MKNGSEDGPAGVFGAMLRHYRTGAGLSTEALGQRIHMSGSLIRKIEDGSRTPTAALAEACEKVPELGCNGALTRLYGLLSGHLKPSAYPGWFAPWTDQEAQAIRLKSFELALVPGLLQTEDYARCLLTDRIGFNGDVEEVVTARIARQAILDRDNPPELFAVIDEAVLHRPVGGPDVMTGQLKHLVELSGRSTILRVIPAATGVHDGLQGAFIIADSADGTSAAYLETGLRGIFITDTDDVAALAATWDRLAAEALPRSASVRLIEEVAQEWTR
jgi:transcriptional regulator with XRE-family HTH domain